MHYRWCARGPLRQGCRLVRWRCIRVQHKKRWAMIANDKRVHFICLCGMCSFCHGSQLSLSGCVRAEDTHSPIWFDITRCVSCLKSTLHRASVEVNNSWYKSSCVQAELNLHVVVSVKGAQWLQVVPGVHMMKRYILEQKKLFWPTAHWPTWSKTDWTVRRRVQCGKYLSWMADSRALVCLPVSDSPN